MSPKSYDCINVYTKYDRGLTLYTTYISTTTKMRINLFSSFQEATISLCPSDAFVSFFH
jgi:hypothetical protein